MINHISNYVENIPENFHTENLILGKGFYAFIKLKSNGLFLNSEYNSFVVKNKGEITKLVEGKLTPCGDEFKLAIRNYYSGLISMNKPLEKKKKIHSSSPFAIWFKKENLEDFTAFLQNYYSRVIELLTESDSAKELFSLIEQFSTNELENRLKSDPLINEIKTTEYVKVFFDAPLADVKNSFKIYLEANVFNTVDFNITKDDETYGMSGFLNGANPKKTFLLHQSTSFASNIRISCKDASNLFLFENLLKNKKVPYTFPIFIDKTELNLDVLRIFSEDKTLSYREIIRKLLDKHRPDLTNYYLINWTFDNGIVINDFDYVDKFDYEMRDFQIYNVMNLPNTPSLVHITNVFDFEFIIVRKIFNNHLIVKTKKETIIFKYFDSPDPKYTPSVYMDNILRYRKSFYDYIYKSRKNAITQEILKKIILSHIAYEITKDEINNGYHTKTTIIKELLNILFAVLNYFKNSKSSITLGEINMASFIPEHQEKIRKLFNETEYHIQSDTEFAFDAGQLINYILRQSKAGNKTHALIEPFISKNDPAQFKIAITRAINTYKHSFEFRSGRFEKLASEVLAYQTSTSINDLLPVLLAGYFSDSLIFEKSNKNNNEKEQANV